MENYQTVHRVDFDMNIYIEQIEPNLHVFARKITPRHKPTSPTPAVFPKGMISAMESQGFLDDKNKVLFLNGEAFELFKLNYISQEHLKLLRLKGWSGFIDQWADEKMHEKANTPWDEFTRSDKKFDINEWYKFDFSCHAIRDRFDHPLPMALFFDYISSGISDHEYDLQKTAEILLARTDVVVVIEDRSNGFTPASNVEEAIWQIPYYNCDDNNTESIQFFWHPEKEDYNRVFELSKDTHQSPSELIRLAMKEDILGLSNANRLMRKSYRP